MLFLISRRYPVAGAVLGVISNIAFIAYGVIDHSRLIFVSSVLFLVLSVVQTVHRKRNSTQPARS